METSDHRGFSDGGSKATRAVPWLVGCFWCERSHPGEHLLSVCPACAAKYSIMRLLEMSECYPLRDEVVCDALERVSAGNYALGYMDGGTFTVFYVGRSDSDVRQRLREWVGMPSHSKTYHPVAKASWRVNRRREFPVDAPARGRVGNVESRYTHFAYSYARSADDAYAKEWRNYEALGGRRGLDNERQPAPPAADASERGSPIFVRRFATAKRKMRIITSEGIAENS